MRSLKSMIKILILFAIIALTTFAGVLLAAEKKKRAQVFAELYEYNELLLLNLKFGREDMKKLAKKFKYVPDALEGKQVLKGADGEFIKSYCANLGATDASSQIDYLNERKAYIKKHMEESLADYKKYSSLYVKIFLMIGVLIAVLLA